MTSTLASGTPGVGMKSGLPSAKPAEGRSEPLGGENLNGSPEGVVMLSVMGLNVVDPEYVMAVMSSGEARKFIVARLPSFRPGKFRLYEVKMALASPFLTPSVRVHWPSLWSAELHGAQS